jgi:uncharacterized membrane protein YbjE (DUF340 family)
MKMRWWEYTGVVVAVVVGAAVGTAYLLADTINEYLNWDPLHASEGGQP